ncbi:phosphoesterase PA-phosphatase [Micromonospora sp. WMMD1120]|uniref:phosphoesterase PA-phosphatase n=1 Tax=Micromonospora sp. WMMD1120 TaxID=3016106 RepID=UPI002417F99E|nr:phosphoesterase PA-phosphatase [Micromonospora sp. WMMD1120]MDG4809499.1 phosphoesterase PA-phosphatase [Micromonospora sp. WMMD1120]
MPVAATIDTTRPLAHGDLGWALLATLFCSVIPNSLIWYQVRRGRLTDHHIRERRQRAKPLAYGLLSVLVGLAVLVGLDAPRTVVAVVVVMFGVGVAVTVINLLWKLSIHAAVAAGSAAILVIVHGVVLLILIPVVAAVGWSRVQLREHTTGQVVAGAAVGLAVAAPTFLLLR